jgi:hypothetical protein
MDTDRRTFFAEVRFVGMGIAGGMVFRAVRYPW